MTYNDENWQDTVKNIFGHCMVVGGGFEGMLDGGMLLRYLFRGLAFLEVGEVGEHGYLYD